LEKTHRPLWVAHCRIFESGRSVAILLPSPVEIRQWPRSPDSDFLDEFSKRQLTKYIGQWPENRQRRVWVEAV
jgi:hypothetical protein